MRPCRDDARVWVPSFREVLVAGKRVAVVGATGMIGGLVLRYALADDAVASVVDIGRRSTGTVHPKLREVRHPDFTECGPLRGALSDIDAAIFCLGVYTGSVPGEEFRRITEGIPVAFGQVLHDTSPQATVCFLSGAGADPTQRSRMAFARYKGAAEARLSALGFPAVHHFRPAYIYPVEARQEPTVSYRVLRALYPLLSRVYPSGVIPSTDLARVMVDVALGRVPQAPEVLENVAIRRLAVL